VTAVQKTIENSGTLRRLEPLNEVILGVSFVAPSFSLVDYGLFYERLRNVYPRVTVQNPIATATEYGQPLYIPSLPRIWLESEDRHSLVQLQENKLIYNWRKIAGVGVYPHFTVVLENFKNAWTSFITFFQDRGPINQQQFELSYVNNIQLDFRKMIKGSIFKWESKDWNRYLPDPRYKVVQYIFKIADQPIDLKVTTRPAIDISTQTEVLAFQLDATSGTPGIPTDRWFNDAHDVIERAFEDLLTKETLKLWRNTTQ
jgi:uncharacterized protein (TIGR04255 family)